MKILMLSTDRNIFNEKSATRKRMIEYGELVEELHIIIFSKRGFKEKQISERVWVYPINSFLKFLYIFNAKKIGFKIIQNSEDLAKWVISTQDPFETGWAGLKILEKTKKKIDKLNAKLQIQIHTDFLSPYFKKESLLNRLRLFIASKTLKSANCVRVVSERIKNSLLENKEYFPSCDIKVLPIYVGKEEIQEKETSFDLPQKYPQFSFIILMVSRLEKEKNIGFAIETLSEVIKEYKKTGLVIVGSGSYRSRLKSKAEKLGIEENIIFEGEKDKSEIIDYYKTANIFLNSSLYEGYARTIVEAGLCSLPILTTDVGLVGSILLPNEDLLVCNVNDKDCFVNKIKELIKDNGKRIVLKRNAKQKLNSTLQEKQRYLEKIKNLWSSC